MPADQWHKSGRTLVRGDEGVAPHVRTVASTQRGPSSFATGAGASGLRMDSNATTLHDALAVCETSRGVEIHARLIRLARQEAVLEIAAAAATVRVAEAFPRCTILLQNRPAYAGRAVVTSLVRTGSVLLCSVALEEAWPKLAVAGLARTSEGLRNGFEELVQQWRQVQRIRAEYKLIVADLQSFLHELRHWCEQVELGFRPTQERSGEGYERAVVEELAVAVAPSLNTLFEQFEYVAGRVEEEHRPTHAAYAQRLLHPLLLCAPFLHRLYRKPLGYAGDYEMVSMLQRDPQEGDSLFAQVLNQWFLGQPPAAAHRERTAFLIRRFAEEALAARTRGGPLRVGGVGCGPAGEVAGFMEQHALANLADFTLIDFNDETLEHAQAVLGEAKRRHCRTTVLRFAKKTIAKILKAGRQPATDEHELIYCAGLFDYLPDWVCRQLLDTLYALLAPGGLLIVTNADNSHPCRHILGQLFDSPLICRNARQLVALAPAAAPPDTRRVSAEVTGGILFLELRKPRQPRA